MPKCHRRQPSKTGRSDSISEPRDAVLPSNYTVAPGADDRPPTCYAWWPFPGKCWNVGLYAREGIVLRFRPGGCTNRPWPGPLNPDSRPCCAPNKTCNKMISTTLDAGSDAEKASAAQTRSDRVSDRMIEDSESPSSPHWSVARRPFWWALLATIALSTAGGMAIYFIHSTTPTTGSGLQSGTRDTSKARVVGNVARPPAGAAGNPGQAPADSALTGQSPTQPLSSAASPGTPLRAGLEPNQPQPLQRGVERAPNAADAGGKPSTVTSTGPATAALPRTAPEASIQWSKDKPAAAGTSNPGNSPAAGNANASGLTSTKAAAPTTTPGMTGRATAEGMGSFPPTAVDSGRGGSAGQQAGTSSRGTGAASGSDGTSAARTNNTTAAAPPNAVQVASARPSAASPAPKLKDAQEKQCAESNFFSRLVCDERVRLRYCRDRWNEHPDCMVNAQQREP